MLVFNLAYKSIMNRKLTSLLTIISISLSVILILSVEKIRKSTRTSFINTISGTDLVIGPRASGIQLLLYSVFHMGDATANITIKTVEDIKKRSEIDWVVPISLQWWWKLAFIITLLIGNIICCCLCFLFSRRH